MAAYVCEYGQKSERVAELQTDLRDNGFEPGPTDGEFGPLTMRALRHFQATQGLAITPLEGGRATAIDRDLLKRLVKSSAKADIYRKSLSERPTLDATHPTIRAILQVAFGELGRGVQEFQLGTNRGPDVDKYTRHSRIPWGAAFLSWCIQEAPIDRNGVPNDWKRYGQVADPRWVYAYTATDWWRILAAAGRLQVAGKSGCRAPEVGDIFIVRTDPGTVVQGVNAGTGHPVVVDWMEVATPLETLYYSHAGWVVGVERDENGVVRKVLTVEGKAGLGVQSRWRGVGTLSGWGRPAPMPE